MKNKIYILLLSLLPTMGFAQKISLGSCVTKDGGQYKGEMVAGKPNGKGNALYKNGDTYEGEYVKGKRQGYGVYTFSDGEKYEGEWFQDQQHGKGVYHFMNNNKYDGLWFLRPRRDRSGHRRTDPAVRRQGEVDSDRLHPAGYHDPADHHQLREGRDRCGAGELL